MNENALKEIKEQKYIFDLDNKEIDIRVKGLIDNLDIKGLKVLDSSTLSGFHSIQLHNAGAKVTASDIRPSNLSKALYRAIYNNVHGIDYRLIDLEDMHNVVKKDEFDIHYFSGSFYHLKSPHKVMQNIANLFKYTLLETHFAEEDRHLPLINKNGYTGWEYSESGWNDPCSSKDNNKSFWLTKKSLYALIYNCNLEVKKVIYDDLYNPHGSRVCLLLESRI